MNVLDKKLLRDLIRLKGQGLAIALVMASGIAVLVMAIGTHRSLSQIRDTYYERYQFAHIFTQVKRAPKRLRPPDRANPRCHQGRTTHYRQCPFSILKA